MTDLSYHEEKLFYIYGFILVIKPEVFRKNILCEKSQLRFNVDFSHRIFFLKTSGRWNVTCQVLLIFPYKNKINISISNIHFCTDFRFPRSFEVWMSWYFYEFVNVRVDSAIAVNSMTHENEWCWWHFVVMFTFAQELCKYVSHLLVIVGHHSIWD